MVYIQSWWFDGGWVFLCDSALRSTVGVVQNRTAAHVQTFLLIKKIDGVIYQEDHF